MLAELGPGSVVGERAVLEGGVRTASLRATTPLRVAVTRGDQLDLSALTQLASAHRREGHLPPAAVQVTGTAAVAARASGAG
jgi:CRP-like cAMP-binding protein